MAAQIQRDQYLRHYRCDALQHLGMSNFVAALPLSEEALSAMRRTLGDEHEHTLVSIACLAAVHNSRRDFSAARPLHEEALAARRRTLGDEHPRTVVAMDVRVLCSEKLSGLDDFFGGARPSDGHSRHATTDCNTCSGSYRPRLVRACAGAREHGGGPGLPLFTRPP